MSVLTRLEDVDFARFVRVGDGVVWGQVTGEPVPLTAVLMAQRSRIGPFSVFLGLSFSNTAQPEHTDVVTFRGVGGAGTNRRLSKEGLLDVVPTHLSAIPSHVEAGRIPCDVAIVQVTPSHEAGFYNYCVISDYIVTAVEMARTVIGEINLAAPRSNARFHIPAERFACLIETNRPVLSVPSAEAGAVERAIAGHVAKFIEDGSVLQVGVGAVPDAILSLLEDRRDLAIHSGMVGDAVVRLIETGVVTNARKPIDTGLSVTGTLIGTERLYRFADRNPHILLETVRHTHGIGVLAHLPKLISLNSALQVDLSGQVNAEVASGVHIGTIGGQVDYVRGATLSPGGHSIIALPATAAGGSASRITAALSGPVTTSRADVDIVVTEYGAAELRGRSLSDRARSLIGIAHPDFREDLARAAHRAGE